MREAPIRDRGECAKCGQSHLIKPREPEREAHVEYFVHETAQAWRGSASALAHTARKGPCRHHSTFYPFLACFSSFWWCLKLVKSQTKVKNLDFQEMTSPGKKTNKSGLLPLRCGHLIGAHGAAGPDCTQKAASPSSPAISTRCPVPQPYLEEPDRVATEHRWRWRCPRKLS